MLYWMTSIRWACLSKRSNFPSSIRWSRIPNLRIRFFISSLVLSSRVIRTSLYLRRRSLSFFFRARSSWRPLILAYCSALFFSSSLILSFRVIIFWLFSSLRTEHTGQQTGYALLTSGRRLSRCQPFASIRSEVSRRRLGDRGCAADSSGIAEVRHSVTALNGLAN